MRWQQRSHARGYGIDDPRNGALRASNGSFCRPIDAGAVPRRGQQSVAGQGNTGAVSRAALATPPKAHAETFTDPCSRLQGRIGARNLEAGRHRPFPDSQGLSDWSMVWRSWAEIA